MGEIKIGLNRSSTHTLMCKNHRFSMLRWIGSFFSPSVCLSSLELGKTIISSRLLHCSMRYPPIASLGIDWRASPLFLSYSRSTTTAWVLLSNHHNYNHVFLSWSKQQAIINTWNKRLPANLFGHFGLYVSTSRRRKDREVERGGGAKCNEYRDEFLDGSLGPIPTSQYWFEAALRNPGHG